MITSTGYKLPQSVISNTGWENEYRLSFQDGTFAYTTQSDNRLVVGNFLLNIPQDNTIYNIEVTVTGYRNSFPTTLKIWAINDTSGTEQAYALSPDFNSFTGNSLSYVIGNTLFGRQWTVDEINNIKLALVSDGELYLDNVSLNVTYYDEFPSPSDGDGVGVAPVCEAIMDEYIQAQPFTLAKTLSPEDTYAIVKSFSMPNNVPITISMVGGKLQAVINQGNGSNEENVAIVDIIHNYNGSGLVKLDFGSLANRGLDFKYPYTAVNQNRKYHIAGSELVLSNSAPFYDRFLIKRDIGCSVSAPIEVEDEDVNIASYLRSLNFKGIPVTATATNNAGGGQDVTVTITGAGGTVPPTITHISTSTTGNSISPVLSWLHESSGVDRLLIVDVSTTQTSSITGVTYNGLPLTLHSTSLNNAGNIRLERWIMTAPTVGIYPIVVNVSPSSYISAGARSFSGVDQATPFDGVVTTLSGNGTSVVSSQTTVTQSSIVLDAIATGFQPIAHNVASGQSVDFTVVNACTRQISGGSQETGSPGVFPTNYSLSAGTNWALLSDGIKGITIASPTAGQNNIQFQDETINLGTSGTVDTVNFTGSGVVATRTGNTVDVTITGGGSGTDELVKVSATDTTTGYLDNKIELVAGTNTTVTKTILNPGANEKIRYQVNSTGGSSVGTVAANYFQDFIGDPVSIGGIGGSILYGGLYPFIVPSGGMGATSYPNHPGVLSVPLSPGPGFTTIGFSLVGVDFNNLTIETMFQLNSPVSSLYLDFVLQFPNSINIQYNTISSTLTVNGINTITPITVGVWNVMNLIFDSTGSNIDVYINNVLITSGVPATTPSGSTGGISGSNVDFDYIKVDGTITR